MTESVKTGADTQLDSIFTQVDDLIYQCEKEGNIDRAVSLLEPYLETAGAPGACSGLFIRRSGLLAAQVVVVTHKERVALRPGWPGHSDQADPRVALIEDRRE